jgi:hypothetical protein
MKINAMTKTKATTGVSDLDVRKRIAKTDPEFKSGIKDVRNSAQAPAKTGAESSRAIDLLKNQKSRLLNKTIEINEYATINGE